MQISGIRLAVAVASLFTLGGQVSAQVVNRVAESRVEVGPWVYHGVYASGSGTASVAVHDVIAFAKPGAIVGENITAVWHHWDGVEWSSKSWLTQDMAEIVKSLAQELNLQESEYEKFDVSAQAFSGTPEQSKGFTTAVLSSDPMAAVVNSAADPQAVISLLTSNGYKSADLPSTKPDDCTTKDRVDSIASNIALFISAGDETIYARSASSLCDVAWGRPPIGPEPTKPAKPATAPAWTPPGTVPSAPAWTPGGWPATWKCSASVGPSGSSTCICSRRQYWGQWQSTTCGWLRPRPCIKWHLIEETETCSDLNVPCPAGGPPATQANCTLTHT